MHGIVKVVAILADRILVCNIGFIDLSIKTELSCFAYRPTETSCHSRIVKYLGYPTNEKRNLDLKFVLLRTSVASTEFDVRLVSKGCRSLLFQGLRHTIPISLGLLPTPPSSRQDYSHAMMMMLMMKRPGPVSSCRWSWFYSKSRCWPKENKNKNHKIHVHEIHV